MKLYYFNDRKVPAIISIANPKDDLATVVLVGVAEGKYLDIPDYDDGDVFMKIWDSNRVVIGRRDR